MQYHESATKTTLNRINNEIYYILSRYGNNMAQNRDQRIHNFKCWNMENMTKEQLALAYAELAVLYLEMEEEK